MHFHLIWHEHNFLAASTQSESHYFVSGLCVMQESSWPSRSKLHISVHLDYPEITVNSKLHPISLEIQTFFPAFRDAMTWADFQLCSFLSVFVPIFPYCFPLPTSFLGKLALQQQQKAKFFPREMSIHHHAINLTHVNRNRNTPMQLAVDHPSIPSPIGLFCCLLDTHYFHVRSK